MLIAKTRLFLWVILNFAAGVSENGSKKYGFVELVGGIDNYADSQSFNKREGSFGMGNEFEMLGLIELVR